MGLFGPGAQVCKPKPKPFISEVHAKVGEGGREIIWKHWQHNFTPFRQGKEQVLFWWLDRGVLDVGRSHDGSAE